MKDVIIFYHADCTDGFGGAWAAWKKFGEKAGYFGISHGNPPMDLKGKEIFFIDIVYKEKDLKKLAKNNKVTIIDHHKSAANLMSLAHDYLFDLNHSGSVLAWKYFHSPKPVPKLLKHVEDTDLWKFKLPYTRELISYINIFDFDFKIWSKIAKDLGDSSKFKEYVKNGNLILRDQDKEIKWLIEENSELVEFEGIKTLAVNSPLFDSQVGSFLAREKMPPIGIVWSKNRQGVKVSLRSDGSVDVSRLAEKYGGGGHKKASGFSIKDIKDIPWKKIK